MTTILMNTIEAKEQFSDLINRVANSKERIVLTRRGKEVAAIIPLEDLKQLDHIQDKHDLQIATDALKQARTHGTMTLEQLIDEMNAQ